MEYARPARRVVVIDKDAGSLATLATRLPEYGLSEIVLSNLATLQYPHPFIRLHP